MLPQLVRRIGLMVFTVWGAVSLTFVILRLAPGDQATVQLGPDATAAEVSALRGELGLDRPIFVQYLDYLGSASTGDFGESYRFHESAMTVILERFPATVVLALTATALALTIGLLLGIMAGRSPGRLADRVISGITLVMQAIPPFWSGIMLILLMALTLRLLPSAGSGDLEHLVLPSVTLAIPFTALVARITRSSVAEVTAEPYILTARSKGLSERAVLARHAVRNSVIPVVTIVSLHIGTLLGGAVIVEQVFAWEGVGSLLVGAVGNRDYAIVQGATVLFAIVVVTMNLLADVLNSRLDPRIRAGAQA
ncbi:ABC transporter permease [Actinophytocola algeriensis]|uniref:Peptide/nickel transport system permease protein n=1 Tax=Actinophytocola algeriensis TaxID=1768010 RepID=A0A7W7VDE2_9PSEU|nr:ABC transporter permease [Actinophytocola algeriensis]MBB4905999.1 peptide/nickel transport system permease protein [Actinophytocola algeriensis]MBE1472316.1 peptide/nickel transport system permease protein [Actinophytocola algeriensis]